MFFLKKAQKQTNKQKNTTENTLERIQSDKWTLERQQTSNANMFLQND